MIRQMIKIDEDKCNGCGLCAQACHEDAIIISNGKAKLIKDDYCDGLGNCLPACPTNAIAFEQREAAAYDEEAVKRRQAMKQQNQIPSGCPGSRSQSMTPTASPANNATASPVQNQLMQWPVQIKLVPVNAPYFENANLLIAADCAAYAYADFHNQFIKNHITIIGCPKLDEGNYEEKLTAIMKENHIKSVSIVRMEVPCCGGLEHAAIQALQNCGKMIPWQVTTLSTDGRILE